MVCQFGFPKNEKWEKYGASGLRLLRLLVGHFVDLLFHHVSATINKGFRDARHFLRGVLNIVGQLEGDWTEWTGWDEFYLYNAWFFFLHVCYHLHFGETHARLRVEDFANFFADFVFEFSQTFFILILMRKIIHT